MLKVYLRHDDMRLQTNLYLIFEDETGQRSIVEPMTLVVSPLHDEHYQKPTMTFEHHYATDFLQGMANELATLGYTPDRLKMSQSELAAVRYHLEDMRKLVFVKGGDRCLESAR